MKLRIFGIHTKIIIPMALLFIAAFVVVGYIATATVHHMVEQNYELRANSLNDVLFRMGYPMNDTMMSRIKSVLNAEIAAADKDGTIIFSTVDGIKGKSIKRERNSLKYSNTSWGKLVSGDDNFEVVQVLVPQMDYQAGKSIQEIKPGNGEIKALPSIKYLAILVPEKEIVDAKTNAVRPIVTFAIIGLITTLLLGFIIARTITGPLRALASASTDIARGSDDSVLSIRSQDEVGELARAMKDMLESIKEAEQRVIQHEKMAAIGQVSAGLAHEIRNPLSSMKMNIQLLRKQVKDSTVAHKAIDNVLSEIDRLDITIDELLSLTRQGKLNLEPVDINELLDETIGLMARQLEHAGVEIKKEYEKRDTGVTGDKRKLRQIFFNLLVNALQAMPKGGTITISTSLHEKDAVKRLIVSIEDEGTGIKDDMKEKIFQMLYSTKPGGSGLGLSIAREIAGEHGGSLELADSDIGAKFVLSIPICGPQTKEDNE